MANLASVKVMAANYRQAFALLEKVDTSQLNSTHKIRHEIKRASVLKKASFYRESLAVLEKCESDLDGSTDV